MIKDIEKWVTYSFAVSKSDINGENWSDIFANAIEGEHLNSPVGLADVVKDRMAGDRMAWPVKSVKKNQPFECEKIRIISGRCSPDYSYSINDFDVDIEVTGRAVLGIGNVRQKIIMNH